MQVSRNLHIFDIGVTARLGLIEHGQKFRSPGRQRPRHILDISPGLLPVREKHKPAAAVRRKHGKSSRNRLLKIGSPPLRKGHNAPKALLGGQKLFHQRIPAEGDDAIGVAARHFRNHPA